MKTQINKELLPMKAHYFLFNAGTSPVMPFMPPLARQLGFSTVVVGTMYTILPIIGMLAKPLFGYLADRYRRHRSLFLLGEILTGVAFFLIMFVPAIDPTVEFHCHNGVSEVRFCSAGDASIEKNLETHYSGSQLTCKLKCKAQQYLWDIVCNDWLQQTEQCDTSASTIDFTTYLNMNSMLLEKKCLFISIPHERAQMNGRNVTMNCPKDKDYFKASCQIEECADNYLIEQLQGSSVIGVSEAVGLYQFWLFFGFLIISWIGMAIVVSIGDAICFSLLGERHHLFGKQRLCGSIGFGIFSLLAGVLVDAMSGDGATKNYTIAFWITAVMMGFDVLASTQLKHTQTHLSTNILKDVGKMFLSVRCVIYFLWCISIGLGTALIWNFLFLYLEELSANIDGGDSSIKTLEGLVSAIQCFGGELPFFFLSGWILKKIGHINAMSVVIFSFGARFILYSLLEDPWYVLPIELMNGITFGLFYSTMASYASIVAPPGTEATMQGLVGAIFEGVGVSLGSFIAGILFSAIGAAHTFEIFGISAFLLFLAHVCVQMFLQRNSAYDAGSQNGVVKYLAPNDAMHMLNENEYVISY